MQAGNRSAMEFTMRAIENEAIIFFLLEIFRAHPYSSRVHQSSACARRKKGWCTSTPSKSATFIRIAEKLRFRQGFQFQGRMSKLFCWLLIYLALWLKHCPDIQGEICEHLWSERVWEKGSVVHHRTILTSCMLIQQRDPPCREFSTLSHTHDA